ncbi:MAG: hypothetical protein Kow00105_01630 [Phycisphaeraceae bacterium]
MGESEPVTYTFDWDFGDGTVITDTTLDQTHTYADDGIYTVTLTVNASDGRVSSDTLIATVNNVAPIVDPIVGPAEGLRGATFSFAGSFTDPGVVDTHTSQWSVTDSAGMVVATGTGNSFEFTPAEAGTFTVTYTVTDDDAGVGSASTTTESRVIIVGPDPVDPSLTTVQVAGSDGRDVIFVGKSYSTPGAIKVIVHELDNGTFTIQDGLTGVDRVIADARGGNDLVKVHRNAGSIQAELFGSAGNDWLRGGIASDFISGGDGHDLISGGDGRDILVGGMDGDLALGNDHDDILIGGVYAQDRDINARRAIQAEWTRTDLGYTDRVANLTNGTGLNGSYVLDSTTVFDDNAFDILLGLRGIDWFHANDAQDLTDQRRNELLTESEVDFVDVDVDYVV